MLAGVIFQLGSFVEFVLAEVERYPGSLFFGLVVFVGSIVSAYVPLHSSSPKPSAKYFLE